MSNETTGIDCLDESELEQFASEQSDTTPQPQIELHLSTCPACRRRLEDVRENLRLVDPLRAALQSGRNDEFEPPIPQTIGGYRVIRRIGEGGMGTVYEAEQENPRRRVALKVIRPGRISATMLRRFRHEVQMLGRLQHAGIAQIHEGGTEQTPDGPRPYFAMELVEGLPLIAFARARALNVRQRLELMAGVCDAVQHAHDKGLVHRDLKPGNILVSETSGRPQPKILDFGVARAMGADLELSTMQTEAGQLVGTIAYMSPEQVSGRGGTLDTRSDVYALGVILYELLAEKLPFDLSRQSVPELVWQIGHDEPTPLSLVNRAFRGDIETIVGKALEKEPRRRYDSAAEMAADIRRHLRDEPIVARPPSTMYQLGKFARRNKGLVGGVVTAFVVLVLGVIGTSMALVRAETARAAAQQNLERATRETAKAEAVNSFLQEMLASADPSQALGRELSVRDALDEAARRLDAGSLAEQPEVEAAVRTTLASAYRTLARFDEADSNLRIALECRRRVHGDAHLDVAMTLKELAETQLARRNYGPAEQLFREALEMTRQVAPGDSEELAAVLAGLANARQVQTGHDEAEALFQESIDMLRRLGGDATKGLAVVLNDYALLHMARGDYSQAETILREVLELRTRLLGELHPARVVTLNNLANLLTRQKRLAEAEPMLRESLALRRKLYGDEHPDVARAMNNLGLLLVESGRYREAEPILRDTLELRRVVLGPRHLEVAVTLNNLAFAVEGCGDPETAETLLRESIEMRKELLGPEHPQVLSAKANLARLVRVRGRPAESESILRDVIEAQIRQLGPDHPNVAATLNSLGSAILNSGGDLQECESVYRRALDIRSRRLGANHPATAITRVNLSKVLIRTGRHEEAERELIQAYADYSSQMGQEHPLTVSIVRQIVTFYEESDRPDAAENYRALLPVAAATPAMPLGREE